MSHALEQGAPRRAETCVESDLRVDKKPHKAIT